MGNTPTKLGRYEIVRELGKGAMGVVYEAVDPAIGRRLAIKTILPDPGLSAQDQSLRMERFAREARAAGIISHPNIVTIYDVGEDAATRTTFFAMEFIDGRDLSKILAERGPLSAEEVISVTAQIADALDYAHSKGIIHRDIKPANIVLTPSGNVKVTDFGIARLETSTLTQTGAYLGTPTFMAPEMISGRKIDKQADLFSLGVLAYQLLTAGRPFTGDNLATLSYQIVNKAPVPLRKHRPELPEPLEAVFAKVLAKQPNDRYPNCTAFVRALKQVLMPGGATSGSDVTKASGTAPTIDYGMGRTSPMGAGDLPTADDDATRFTPTGTKSVLKTIDTTVSQVGGAGGIVIGAAVGVGAFLFVAVLLLAGWFLFQGTEPRNTARLVPTKASPAATRSPSLPVPSPTTGMTPVPTNDLTPVPTETPAALPTVDPKEEERKRAEEARKKRNEVRWKRAIGAYAREDYDTAIDSLVALLKDDPDGYPQAATMLENVRRAKRDAEQPPPPSPPPVETTPTAPQHATDSGEDSTNAKDGHKDSGSGKDNGSGKKKDTDKKDDEEPSGVEDVGDGATLDIKFQHRLKGGTIRVFVDGHLAAEDEFKGSKKKVFRLGKFALGKESTYRKKIEVAPGSHDVKVEVEAKGGIHSHDHSKEEFDEGETMQLNVGIGNVDHAVELEWD